MDNMAQLLQMMMSGSGDSSDDNSDSSEPTSENSGESVHNHNDNNDSSDDSGFDGFFDNIDIDMIAKMGEMFSNMNKPDRNSELLIALRGHLREENRHKVDSALKMSKMFTMLPLLKDSGILNDLF